MAMAPFTLYIDGVQFSTNASGGTYSVTSTGLALSSGETWTYTGTNTFLGFSISDGGSVYTGLGVGDSDRCAETFANAKNDYYQGSGAEGAPLYLYSVEAIPVPVTVTYKNIERGALHNLGAKMRLNLSGQFTDDYIYIACDPQTDTKIKIYCAQDGNDDAEMESVREVTAAGTVRLNCNDHYWHPYNTIIKILNARTYFSIDNTTYEFDENSYYWSDWISSSFAPSGSSIEFDEINQRYYVHIGGTASNYGVTYSGGFISPGDEIVENRSYSTAAAYEIHDLTGTTWYFNSSPSYPFTTGNYSINFTSNSTNYTNFVVDDYEIQYSDGMGYDTAYGPRSGPPEWYSQNYRTIYITGGTDATNAALYAFISSNATQIQSGTYSGGND